MGKWFVGILIDKLLSALIDWLERHFEEKREEKDKDKVRKEKLERAKKVISDVKEAKTKEQTRTILDRLP